MENKRGKFITVEGCEGAGKSTQIHLLRLYCMQNGIDAVFTREPGGTPIAEKIRGVILDAENAGMDSLTELFLYAAARRQHTAELIAPALQTGQTVFCDRYTDSTLAYQGYGRGINKSIIQKLNSFAMAGVKIDCTVFMDITPRDGFLRKGGKDTNDRLENESLEFHERVYRGFKAIGQADPERFLSVCADGTQAEIHERVINALKNKGVF